MLEAELRDSVFNLDLSSRDIGFLDHRSPSCEVIKQNSSIVSGFS